MNLFQKALITPLLGAIFISSPGSSIAVSNVKGTVKIDGSSTVFPISEAVAEEFGKEAPRIRVTIGVSGTGGGFKKFIAGETDISNASRPIKKQEAAAAKKAGIQYIELPVAYDGIAVVVNKKNTWVDSLSVEELNKIWKPGSTVKKWSDVRVGWPNDEIKLYGPGTDSGTFDYFTEVINDKAQSSRSDFTKSEDDNVLVQGVMGDKGALGYFGYAYYIENQKDLRVIPIRPVQKNKKAAAVTPTVETIKSGKYSPLSRPIYIYVRLDAAQKNPAVREFVTYFLEKGAKLVQDTGYIPMSAQEYSTALGKFRKMAAAQTVGQR